jgi:hypothetical protein
MRRCIGKQANLANIQIGKNLPTQANLAQNTLMPILPMLAAAVQEQPMWHNATINLETFT